MIPWRSQNEKNTDKGFGVTGTVVVANVVGGRASGTTILGGGRGHLLVLVCEGKRS